MHHKKFHAERIQYLARIAYPGLTDPSVESLRLLHRAHLFHVPFENLDIGIGRPIVCDQTRFLRKIVEERRGGFCYEMNGAFAWLLTELGFKVTLLSARVGRADGSVGPEFDHLALRVDLDEPWLADVGFGDSFVDPLQLKPEVEQVQENGTFRIVKHDERWAVERKGTDATWKTEYAFTMIPRRIEEFAEMCRYHQTSPQSHFTQNKVCTLATPKGRITLSQGKLTITEHGEKRELPVSDEAEWLRILQDKFQIVLPAK